MAELDKVIKSLELCCYRDETFRNPLEHGFNCGNCPYFSECDKIHSFCGDKLKKDALELLKEQEKEIEELRASASAYAELLVKYGYDFK